MEIDIFKKTENQLRELELEVEKKKLDFLSRFKELKKQDMGVDQELLKEFLKEYWYIKQRSESEWEIIVPRFLSFSVGWLDHTTKGYNVFIINKYTQWLGELPEFLRQEIQLKEPRKITFDGENLKFKEGTEEEIKVDFGDKLSSITKGSARIKRGKEFDLIASIIDSGSLPFVPAPVDKKDLRDPEVNFSFKGKYEFQREAYKQFLKYGSVGIYWMTGAGKSFLAMYVLDTIEGRKALVVPTLTLKEQWLEYFKEYAPRLEKEVELITYQSYDKIKQNEYKLIAFDECHVLPADTFSRLATLKTKYRLGLSATPYREDKRTNYIFALTGYPIGLDWQSLMKILGKDYHDINVYIVSSLQQKINLVSNLLNREKKTIIFINELDIGHRLANGLGLPFIHGSTKNRMELARNSKIFIASRVMELGISLKDLQHIIEVDFLFGSKREQLQRSGRLFHSEHAEKHDIIFTKEEFERYGKRLHSLIEKGFRINLKPMITGTFQIRKPEMVKGSSKSKRTGLDVYDIIENLFDEGFFREPITAIKVAERTQKRGIILSSRVKQRVNDKLKTLVKQKKLAKFKQGGSSVYQER